MIESYYNDNILIIIADITDKININSIRFSKKTIS